MLDPAEKVAIHETLARYASALDQRDPAALEGVLTEDATWTFTTADGKTLGPIPGRAAILEFVAGAAAAQTAQQRHHLTNIVVQGAGEVRAYLMLTEDGRLATTGSFTFGLRCVQDEWRIADLRLDLDGTQPGTSS
jgi:ketosteroid isomerase-like protein